MFIGTLGIQHKTHLLIIFNLFIHKMLIQLWQKTDFSVVYGIKLFNLINIDVIGAAKDIEGHRLYYHYKYDLFN